MGLENNISYIHFDIFPNTDEMYIEPNLRINENDFEEIKSCFLLKVKEIDFIFYTDYDYNESIIVVENLKRMQKQTKLILSVINFISDILKEFNGFTISSNQ